MTRSYTLPPIVFGTGLAQIEKDVASQVNHVILGMAEIDPILGA
jgi:hypothetical protein